MAIDYEQYGKRRRWELRRQSHLVSLLRTLVTPEQFRRACDTATTEAGAPEWLDYQSRYVADLNKRVRFLEHEIEQKNSKLVKGDFTAPRAPDLEGRIANQRHELAEMQKLIDKQQATIDRLQVWVPKPAVEA